MQERLYQGQFNEQGDLTSHQDVTPNGFRGLPELPTTTENLYPLSSHRPARAELGRFVSEVRESTLISSPKIAVDYLLKHIYTDPFETIDQEEMWGLLLNRRNIVTHQVLIYRGTVDQSVVRLSELFKEAIRVNNTVAIVLSHNHPSGEPDPSPEDIRLTKKAYKAGMELGIELLDHVIIGSNQRWVSLKEHGAGFEDLH